ncbi:hypothetical protein CTAYLR_008533 [Chrysophaeum taylorii]|uniref:DNA methyltransferase n=1 Tax=Chrysophaeum taylorii TaxID=2483200 RepID=A0AAD7XGV4_9STRA|nr:hypothetical protein CTAYLR_008533 [Chrysophaeum taylorii]
MIRCVEFYSGLGGWAYAAARCEGLEIVLSVDVSTTCNEIYFHNWGRRPAQRRIETMDASELRGFDVWLLSPPCQPHTRQREDGRVDDLDPRSWSLAHLAGLMAVAAPRLFACLENVVGFEKSRSCEAWHSALRAAGFAVHWWHATPTDMGTPNDRPRYFECAVRGGRDPAKPGRTLAPRRPARPLADFLEAGNEGLRVSEATLAKTAAWCLDVVAADSPHPASCFTKSYGRYVRGTGSVLLCRGEHADLERLHLARDDPAKRTFRPREAEWPPLRYFSPREIANLLGFPPAGGRAPRHFEFPSSISTRAAWATLGNSLHIPTAVAVIRFGLREGFHGDDDDDVGHSRRSEAGESAGDVSR